MSMNVKSMLHVHMSARMSKEGEYCVFSSEKNAEPPVNSHVC